MKNKKPAPKKKIQPVFVKAKNKRVYKFHNFFNKERPGSESKTRINLPRINHVEIKYD
ncbi:MAG: hypothetical protein IPM96_00475 [Ignavibacteria bacterium]|nr:hypothetical protein [Ignavibacteria bacterium]